MKEKPNWNFDDVPTSELAACCVWEYARESETLVLRAGCEEWWWDSQPVKPNPKGDGLVRNAPEAQERAKALLKQVREKTGFDIEAFRDAFWNHNFVAVFGSASRVPHEMYSFLEVVGAPATSWQELPSEARCFLAKTNANPFQYASAYDLREFLKHHNRLNVAKIGPDEKDTLSEAIREHQSLAPVQIHPGRMVAAFEIDWNSYSKTEIADHLSKWAHENRLSSLSKSRLRGRKTGFDSAKKLRDLGVMRLMNFSTVADMKNRCPEAAQRYQDWQSTHWTAARKRALRNFRLLLPFLPKGELPIHAETAGRLARLKRKVVHS